MDMVETLINLEKTVSRESNPGYEVSENLRRAIMSMVNYDLYMDKQPQFPSFEAYMDYRLDCDVEAHVAEQEAIGEAIAAAAEAEAEARYSGVAE